MPFKKGQSGNPKGRPKGSKNLTTEQIRDAFQALIESSLPDIQKWLQQVAKQNPEKALRIIEAYSDFGIAPITTYKGALDSLSQHRQNG